MRAKALQDPLICIYIYRERHVFGPLHVIMGEQGEEVGRERTVFLQGGGKK